MIKSKVIFAVILAITVYFWVKSNKLKDEEKEKMQMSMTPEGKKYRNCFGIEALGKQYQVTVYSNAEYNVETFIDNCDLVKRDGNGFTIQQPETIVFIPISKVDCANVTNRELIRKEENS